MTMMTNEQKDLFNRAMLTAVVMLWATVLLIVCLGKEAILQHKTLASDTTPVQQEEVVESKHYSEHIDTSIIDTWCGDYCSGDLRLIGACVYSRNPEEGTVVAVDELGTLWEFYGEVEDNDFLLLWIADNHTPDIEEDDMVIKVWREVC